MRSVGIRHGSWLAAMIWFIAAGQGIAQQLPSSGRVGAFTNNMYFAHPNEQQVQTRFTGTEGTPMPGGLLDLKDLTVQAFNTNGSLQLTAHAPQCTYAVLKGDVNSASHLNMDSGDGKFHLEGDGFHLVLKKNESSLLVSNQVHTVILNGLLPP